MDGWVNRGIKRWIERRKEDIFIHLGELSGVWIIPVNDSPGGQPLMQGLALTEHLLSPPPWTRLIWTQDRAPPWEEGRSPGDQGEGPSLLEPSRLCRGVLLQRGAMEAAEEVHHSGPAGPRHGEARRRGADPGGGPMSGGGAAGDKRSAGRPTVAGTSSLRARLGDLFTPPLSSSTFHPPCYLPEGPCPWHCHVTLSASSFSLCVLSHVRLFVTLWTIARQAPPSMGFSRQEYWSRLSHPPLIDLPDPGIKPASPSSPALEGGIFTTGPPFSIFLLFCPVSLSLTLSLFFPLAKPSQVACGI